MNLSGCTYRIAAVAAAALWIAQGAFAAHLLDAAPRNIQFSNLSTEDGFSSEFIQDMVQDGTGYMWFASQAGLHRFDGHTIRIYEHSSGDATTLGNNYVRSLYIDNAGVLWAGTNKGVSSYNRATDSFERQTLGPEIASLQVQRIAQDRTGKFWIASVRAGLFSVDAATGETTHYSHDPEDTQSLPDNNVTNILEDRNGELWIGTNGGGLARLNREDGSFFRFRHQPGQKDSLSNNVIRSIYEDSAGKLWVGTTEGGLNRFNRETGRFIRYQHDPNDPHSVGSGQIRAIFEDSDGTLWIGSEGGLSEWRPAIAGFVNYRKDAADRKSLVSNSVNAIMQDASGVLWLATHGGVSAWNYVSDTFQHYDSVHGFLQSDYVTSIAQTSDGVTWVGTYGGGLSRLDLSAGSIRHFRHDPDDATSIGDDRVTTVHVGADDTVWVGTRNAGLGRLEEDGSFTRFVSDAADETTLSGNAITRILDDRNGKLWIGVFGGGLNRLEWQEGAPIFQRFRHKPGDPASLSGDRVLEIFEDSAGEIWVGTEDAGLNRFVASKNSFVRFDIEPDSAAGNADPVNGTPWELYESADGSLWIGTIGQGLLRWSAADRAAGLTRFDQYESAAGLTSQIYAIAEGQAGELWLSSSRGLYRFDPVPGNVRKFDRTNGLRNNEFNQGASLVSRNGLITFGGTSGLVTFNPEDLRHNYRPPSIEIVAKSRTATLLRASERLTTGIELGYTDPFVAFEFVALDFVSPDKNKYRFRLNGYDADWNAAQGYRRATYSNLPAGEYEFEVQASNSDGVWNRKGVSMPLHILPPPWRTLWAYAAYAFVAAVLLLLITNGQRRKARLETARRQRLEELINQRTTALAERNEDLLQLNQRLKDASVTDQLTGLRNRRFVDQFIDAEVSGVRRRQIESNAQPDGTGRVSSTLLCLIMIDLDGFKHVNDTHGHQAGDEVLLDVKERLCVGCRDSDVVVRWGGDEFLIIGHCSSLEGSQVLADKLRRLLADEPYNLSNGHQATLSGSIGISAIPFVDGGTVMCDWEQVIAIADQAAYLAKSNGRNAWVSIRGTDLITLEDLKDIKENLPGLVDDGKLVVASSVPYGFSLTTDKPIARIWGV